METSPVQNAATRETDAVRDPAVVRAPYYRAWRDLWKHRFGRDPSFRAPRRWLLLATYAGMIGGFALAVYFEMWLGTVFGFVVCAGASGLDEYAKHRRVAKGFASCITARPVGDAAALLREDWAAFIAPLGGTGRLLPWNRQVRA